MNDYISRLQGSSNDKFDVVLNNIERFRDDKDFTASMIPYTERKLIDVMLDKIVPIKNGEVDIEIAIIYTVEMAFNLVRMGFTNITMIVCEHDSKIENFCRKYDAKYLIMDIDEEVNMPKFDVVIGNPPYQDSIAKSSKKLWPLFVEKSIKMLKKNGYMGLITPASWMAGQSSVYDILQKYNTIYINSDISHHFKGVGSTFSYYILEKVESKHETRINDMSAPVDLSKRKILPKTCTDITISIFDKVSTDDTININYDSFCHSQRKDRINEKKSKIFKYPNRHGSESFIWSKVPHKCSSMSKVMMYMSGKPKPVFDDGVYGISEHYAYIPCTAGEAENIISYFESKLIKFLIQNSSFAQAWNKVYLKTIPNIDFSRKWSDKNFP